MPRASRQTSRPATAPRQLLGPDLAALLEGHLTRLHNAYRHPNRLLHMDQVLVAYLLCFFESTVRSLRTIEDASAANAALAEQVGLERLCRSTLSDALELFDPNLLLPLVQRLKELAGSGAIAQRDPALHALVQRIIACDGSLFRVAADVAHALKLTRRNGKTLGQVRLNLTLDALSMLPEDLSVSGHAQASEPLAFRRHLTPGAIHLYDRNFVDFALVGDVLEVGDLVLRAKSHIPTFAPRCELPLSAKDREHGVISDRIGYLPGLGAPKQWLREVVIIDPQTGQTVRLITSLLETAAYVVGMLYRHRWQVELFFRWLKVHANFEHLISHSEKGLTFGFYVALIASLVTHVRAGRKRLSKTTYQMLSLLASGRATLPAVLGVLERRERERRLEKERLARKKAGAGSEKTNA